jgi:HEAT repeat protein
MSRAEPEIEGVIQVRNARDRGDVQELINHLRDTDRFSRLGAAQALGSLGDQSAVLPLLRCLHAHDELLQVSALKALAAIGDAGAIPDVFATATGDASFGVRSTAAETLARLGDERGVPLLTAMVLATDNPYPASYLRWLLKLLVQLRAFEAISALRTIEKNAGFVGRLRLRLGIRTLRRLEGRSQRTA